MPKRFEPWTPQMNSVEAERIVLQQPEELIAWLKSEGLVMADMKEVSWGTMMAEFTRAGTKHAAKAWHDRAKVSLVQFRVTERPKVAAKIANRFLSAQMEKSGSEIRPIGQEPTSLSGLAPEEIWVFRHPLLQYPTDYKAGCCSECKRPFTNPVVQALIADYERENKAPNEAAILLLRLCHENPKFIEDIWKKRGGINKVEEVAKPVELSEAQERIELLKAQLAGSCDDNAA